MSNAQGQFLTANVHFMELFGFESEEQVKATGFFHMVSGPVLSSSYSYSYSSSSCSYYYYYYYYS